MQTEHNLLADPCPPNSMLNRLAHNVLKYQQLKNENLDDLIDYPYLGMDREAKKLGLRSAKELVQVYQKCVSENPEPSAPPMDGGRRRSRKYKNRRSSKRSKRCKRSRRRN